MRRYAVFAICVFIMVSPATAISLFSKTWKDHYLMAKGVNPNFVKIGRKAGCYVCHVKGKDKKEHRNEYGQALSEHLKAEDFPKDWVKANPEKAKAKIIEAFKKVEEELSKDKQKFGIKIKNGKLPAIDAGI